MNATPTRLLLGTEEEERTSGKASYLDVLSRLHRELGPKLYLEIGVRHGGSLVRALGPAIGVDPEPALRVALPETARIVAATSEAFFASPPSGLAPDFAFIDGLHLFEAALRDFIAIEACAAPGAVVAIDDVFPNHPAQAERQRRTRVWTGDVWRLLPSLRNNRPDLEIVALDTRPTGLLLVARLDRNNRILTRRFDEIVGAAGGVAEVPPEILRRDGALDPEGEDFARILESWKAAR